MEEVKGPERKANSRVLI